MVERWPSDRLLQRFDSFHLSFLLQSMKTLYMRLRTFPIRFFVILGMLLILGLQLAFVMFWQDFYSHMPFPGNSDPVSGPPYILASVGTAITTLAVLFVVPLGVLWFSRSGSLAGTAGLLLGSILTCIIIWLSIEQLRNDSSMWPIDLALLTILVAIPLYLGCLVQMAMQFVHKQIMN